MSSTITLENNDLLLREEGGGFIDYDSPSGTSGSYPFPFSYTEVVSKPVWKLAYAGEYIFAGTGDQGYILRSSNGYHWENYYKTNDFHVTALFVFNNNLYSGTMPNGYLYITDLTTNETVLSQQLGGDIVSFTELNGEIYVAINNPQKVYKLNSIGKWDIFYEPFTSKIYRLYVKNGELTLLIK